MRRTMLVATFVALFAFIFRVGAASGQELPPGPQVVYRTTMEVGNPPTAFETINLVLDFAPGTWTPLHTHGGQGIVTVLEGELVHRPKGDEERYCDRATASWKRPAMPTSPVTIVWPIRVCCSQPCCRRVRR